jgi:predicted nucleotide-binding protein
MMGACIGMASRPRGQREEARRTHSEKSVTFASIIVERHPGSRIEARFALATEHPDDDAYECRHKDQKVDCPSHG